MEKPQSRKKLSIGKIIIVIIFVVLWFPIPTMVISVLFRPFAMEPLPAYPSSTAVRLATTNDFEQAITFCGSSLYICYIDEANLHFQTFTTSDAVTNIVDFYEKFGQKVGYTNINGITLVNENLIFRRNFITNGFWDEWITEDQNITGVIILDESNPYDAKIIAQVIKQPTPNIKIIVLVQGFGRFYEDY